MADKKNWLEQTSERKFEANAEDIELQKLGDMERTGTLDAGTLRSMGLYMDRSDTQSTDAFADIDGRTKYLLTIVVALQAVSFLLLAFGAMTESWSEFKVTIFEDQAQTELKGSLGLWEYCYEMDNMNCGIFEAGNVTVVPCLECIDSSTRAIERTCRRTDAKCRANFGQLSCDLDRSVLQGSACSTLVTARSFGMLAALLSASLVCIFLARKFSRSAYDSVLLSTLSYGIAAASILCAVLGISIFFSSDDHCNSVVIGPLEYPGVSEIDCELGSAAVVWIFGILMQAAVALLYFYEKKAEPSEARE